jgi:TolA-binding protein
VGAQENLHRFYTHSLYKSSHKGVIIMPTKSDIEYQIKELKMDYMNLQGDIEKLESTGHNDQVEKAEQRLANMEAKLAELNKQLAEL